MAVDLRRLRLRLQRELAQQLEYLAVHAAADLPSDLGLEDGWDIASNRAQQRREIIALLDEADSLRRTVEGMERALGIDETPCAEPDEDDEHEPF